MRTCFYIILLVLLLYALLVELLTGFIPYWIWRVGSVAGYLLNAFQLGVCSWKESAFTFSVLVVLMYFLLKSDIKLIGGGGMKIILMLGAYFGRYVLITIVVTYILLVIWGVLKLFVGCRILKKEVSREMCVMPEIILATLLTFFMSTFV